jgi:hypothetical protein
VIVIDALAADGREMFDAPHALVDKQTGALTLHYELLGRLPASDLVPVGDVPERVRPTQLRTSANACG